MKVHTVLVLFAFFGVMTVVISQVKGRTYCGRELAIALDLICNGQLIKRSETPKNNNELDWPWIPSHTAHSLNRIKRQNVVSECCLKPCTVNELLTYCGN
ncbi:bombyxin A-1 homolog [Pararge aegeria]|uniref:Jg12400 protein n=1 Tax=Pararge aegeria aegeria TaxID=348720 RepID=A0A8S4S8B5_9NEOP|nr:bombyxin A-1 homolog [Pararge aegeria]CAH2258648.1 jg12400 [Pararge aegeria aegeria]